jgi:hypothetical protein
MTLRSVVIAVLGCSLLLAIVPAVTHHSTGWIVLVAYWAVALGLILVERRRYRPIVTGKNFAPTPERYRDPVSGQTIDVYADPATGERDYRPQPGER